MEVDAGFVAVSWSTTNAVDCAASGAWSGVKSATSGSERVNVAAGTTNAFVMSCKNAGGSASDSVTATVYQPLSASVFISPNIALTGDTVSLTANAAGGKPNSYSYLWSGDENLSGIAKSVSKIYSASGLKKVIAEVTSGAQKTRVSASVTINTPPPALDLSSDKTTVSFGDSIKLTWRSQNASRKFRQVCQSRQLILKPTVRTGRWKRNTRSP